jgi:hypothetical protein
VYSLCVASAITVLLVSSMPAIVHAQEVPERRPTRPLFGAPDPRGESEGGIWVSGTLFGSYDDNLLLSSQDSQNRPPLFPIVTREPIAGAATGYDTTLFLKAPGERPAFEASVVSEGRYFPEFNEFVSGRQMAQAVSSVATTPWRDTTFRATGSGRYSLNAPPFATASSLSDSDVDLPDGGDSVRLRHTNDVRGMVELERDWSGRKSLGVIGGVHSSQIDGGERQEIYDIGARMAARMSRSGTFRASYIRQDVDRVGAHYVVHRLNIGGDYARPLSASRRSFIAFSGGSSAIESRDSLRMNVIGDASFWYEFKQSWIGALRYHRGVTFLDEVPDPLMADSVTAEMTGLLSPRVDFNSSATFSSGVVGLDNGEPYQMYGARARLRYAVSRMMALYGEYLLFSYQFPESVPLTGGLPSAFNRQAVRVGLMVSTRLAELGRRR